MILVINDFAPQWFYLPTPLKLTNLSVDLAFSYVPSPTAHSRLGLAGLSTTARCINNTNAYNTTVFYKAI